MDTLTTFINQLQLPYYISCDEILLLGFGSEYINTRKLDKRIDVIDIQKFDLSNDSNIRIFQKDLNTSFFCQKKYDLIIGNFILEYIDDKSLFLKNVSQSLKKGGIVIFCMWFHKRHLTEDLEAGFHRLFIKHELRISKIDVYSNNEIKKMQVLWIESKKGGPYD